MNRNDKNEKTTLTVYNAEDGVNKVDLPVGQLVRFEENDASLFIVEVASGCASCALDGGDEEETLFPCEAFACCESRRRDGTDVILRRVEGSDDGALAERALTICRRRYGPFVDLGDLRRALTVFAVDRPVAIRLPDGRRFAVADVRLDRESGEPVEDAAVLLIAGAGESRPKEELEQTRVKELAVAARVCVNKGSLRSTSALVCVINSEGDVAPYFVAPFEVVGGDKTVERAIFDKIRGAGLFGDRDERDVRVHYWKTNVERKSLVESCPASFRILGVIH